MDEISSGSGSESEHDVGPTPEELQDLIDKTQAKLDGQPTDPNDPDFDERKIAQLRQKVIDLTEQRQALMGSKSDKERWAAELIQRLYRNRHARRIMHEMVQSTFEKVYDYNQGAYFYYNKKSGETSWQAPKTLKAAGDKDIDAVTTIGKPSGFDDKPYEEPAPIAEEDPERGFNIDRWSIEHVVEWFEEVTLDQFQYKWKEQVMDAFRRNQVNGPVLNTLDYQDFKEIGVLSGLHIKRMMVKLKHIRMRFERDEERRRREEEGDFLESESDIEYSSSDDESEEDDEEEESGGGSDSDDADDSDEDDELTPEELEALKKDEQNIKVEVIFPGDNERYPRRGDIVRVHYTSYLADGMQFDSSRARGAPFEFKVGSGHVVKGWDRGIVKMSFGERAMLHIKAPYAYGGKSLPPFIKPHTALKFDLELISWRTPPVWEKPLIIPEEDLMVSDKDDYFWKPSSENAADNDFEVDGGD